eukprot:750153-Hanusia_phi.AAC.1
MGRREEGGEKEGREEGREQQEGVESEENESRRAGGQEGDAYDVPLPRSIFPAPTSPSSSNAPSASARPSDSMSIQSKSLSSRALAARKQTLDTSVRSGGYSEVQPRGTSREATTFLSSWDQPSLFSPMILMASWEELSIACWVSGSGSGQTPGMGPARAAAGGAAPPRSAAFIEERGLVSSFCCCEEEIRRVREESGV